MLTGGSVLHPKTMEELATEYGDLACFALQLLGLICARTERLARAAEAFKRSLKLNPFLWQSFVALCDQGDKCDPSKVFRLDSLDSLSGCHGNTVLTLVNNNAHPVTPDAILTTSGGITTSNNTNTTNTTQATHDTSNTTNTNTTQSHHHQTPQQQTQSQQQIPLLTPLQNTSNNMVVGSLGQTPTNSPVPLTSLNTPVALTLTSVVGDSGGGGDGILQAPKKKKVVRVRSVMSGGPMSLSPLTPSFGVLPLESLTPLNDSDHSSTLNTSVAFLTPSPLSLSQLDTEPNTKVPQPLSKRVSYGVVDSR